MGRQQLKKLADFVARRREIAGMYTQAFSKLGFCLAPVDRGNVYYRYIIKVNQDVERWIQYMETEGVSCAKPVFKPLHLYNDGERRSGTDSVFKQALSIPIFPSLSETEIQRIIKAVIQTQETLS